MDEQKRVISAFEHENDMMHLGRANHRMLIALIVVCVTFIITILVFVKGYTERESNWLNTLVHMRNTEATSDELHQQPDH